ncbi:KUP system potassium uptake protein [Pseudochelatococcus lubricantis]|uniref:Probable potassium transport system protein Kup n=1 Tax=Pseudochelatococcus lubricantis TaxID=1538102 RepID=A0ABX0UVM9_9HYPH|nr:potassium transporter Kup [Pseudochelatococcus lubricantis]NIJ57011.1 KUP system potassium uptake protein [Pseudochelatococcus lubricantis]
MTEGKGVSPAAAAQDRNDSETERAENAAPSAQQLHVLVIGAIGVVFGDIGTSPLYALRESVLAASAGGPLLRSSVVGVLSLILWTLILVVTCKYVLILLRADNKGEGGTLTLVALAQRVLGKGRPSILLIGMLGAALFYGDSIISPAMSVLSAVEGVKLATPALDDYVVPITIAVLFGLFISQRYGTARVATLFGPVMILWFSAIGLVGLLHLFDDPAVFAAFNPYFGVRFLYQHPGIAVAVLGGVCLAATGAEALYADLGHFGRKPISVAWLYFVFPALALNYLGQGAMLLAHPEAIDNPFYRLVPEWALLPYIVLATLATIVASQAGITGAFSLTRQAIQLGLLPRMEVRFTSAEHAGQIYMPKVNRLLLVGVLVLVVAFQTSSALSHAYGISVFGAMLMDGLLAILVVWKGWKWGLAAALALLLPFVVIDAAFLAANLGKLVSGGWVPVVLAIFLVVIMSTWRKGTGILFAKTRKTDVPLRDLVEMLRTNPPHRVRGMAVFLTSDPETAPSALLHNLKHNKVLHEKNVILTITTDDTPRLSDNERVTLEPLADSFWQVTMRFGYMESPNIPKGLSILRKLGFKFDIMSTSFFLSRRSIRPAAKSGMPLWQDHLFISLARNASDATDFFQIPTGRVVEVGTQVTV